MEFSWNPNTNCTEKPQSSSSTHPFSDVPLFQKHRDTSFHISLNSLGFYLSECLLNFLWLVYSTMCGKKFSIYGVHIPRKCIESMHFYSCPSPPLKTPGRIFWKSVSPKTKGVEETMICFIKIQSENMKMTWNISLFIFCMICNFSKCDGFTILWIISIK